MQNIITALVKARSEVAAIEKNAKNPHFKSDYADINAIISAIEGALASNGIVAVQGAMWGGAEVGQVLVTTLYHKSGDKLDCGHVPLVNLSDMQKVGSGFTYARRYGLQAALMLRAQDDDGNKASEPERRKTDAEMMKGAPPEVIAYFKSKGKSDAQILAKCKAYLFDWVKLAALVEKAQEKEGL